MKIVLDYEVLTNLKCRHGCSDSIVGIYYFPTGCVCSDEQVQALCLQHMKKAESNLVHRQIFSLMTFE